MARLATVWSRALGSGGAEGRIQNPLCLNTSSGRRSHNHGSLSARFSKVPCPQGGGTSHAPKGGHSRSHAQFRRLLQSVVCGPEGFRRLETCLRRLQPKQVCRSDSLQHGVTPQGDGCSSTWRLDVHSRHEGRVFPCPHSPGLTEIPEVCVRGQGLSVQGPVFRSVLGTSGVHQSLSSVSEVAASAGGQDSSLPRRLAGSGKVPGGRSSSERSCSFSHFPTRSSAEHGEIHVESIPEGDLPGHGSRLQPHDCVSNPQEGPEFDKTLTRVQSSPIPLSPQVAGPHRPYGLFREVSSSRSPQVETFSVLDQPEVGSPSGSKGCHHSSSFLSSSGSPLVGRRRSLAQRSPSSPFQPKLGNLLRCLQAWVGGSSGLSGSLGPLEQRREGTPHQCSRTSRDVEIPSTLGVHPEGKVSGSMRGQHHCSRIHQEPRGHQVFLPLPSRGEDPLLGLGKRHLVDDPIHPGSTQCPRRSTESRGPSSVHRMDPLDSDLSSDLAEVGHSPNRPVCDSKELSSPSLLLSRPGPSSMGHRCHASEVGREISLRISTFRRDQVSDQQAPGLSEHHVDFGSSLVATERMVPRSVPPVHGTSSTPSSARRPPDSASLRRISSRPPRSLASRVETIKRLLKAAGFSRASAYAISQPCRGSTSSLYQARWLTFRSWCHNRSW